MTLIFLVLKLSLSMDFPRGGIMKIFMVIMALLIMGACSKQRTTQEAPNPPQPNHMTKEKRDAECRRVQRELAQHAMRVHYAVIRGDTGALVGLELEAGHVNRLKARAAELECPEVSNTFGEAQGGRLSFDECFKKCKELTSRTDEQCFDACR